MKALETTQSTIKNTGLKVTPARILVLELLEKNHKPLSVKDIGKKLVKENLDQVTIYRVLESFTKANLVRTVLLGDGQTYYEARDEHDHHHLVCEKCRKISDFTGCIAPDAIKKALVQSKDFASVTRHSFELFGICKSCAKK
jgi:Fe2+ or Zn2+ uptake regulation protein